LPTQRYRRSFRDRYDRVNLKYHKTAELITVISHEKYRSYNNNYHICNIKRIPVHELCGKYQGYFSGL